MRSFLVCWLLVGTALADPRITFEGVLADDDGVLVEDTVNLTFAVYSEPEGGAALWTETHLGVEVVAGDFFATLGEIEPFGAVLATDGALWLGLSVDGAPEMLPRNPMTEVPRAAAALWAADVTGRDIHPRSVSVGERPVIDAEGNWVGAAGPGGGGAADYRYRFQMISGTHNTVCGVLLDGEALCWGATDGVLEPPSGPFVSVGAGDRFACGLRPNGEVVCWGSQFVAVIPPANYVQLSVGLDHACALSDRAAVACFGLGDGSLVIPFGSYTAVAAGREFSCGLIEGSGAITCWADQGTLPPRIGGDGYVALTANQGACGLRADGTSACNAAGGDLGNDAYTSVAAGRGHVCGALRAGGTRCGGENLHGEARRQRFGELHGMTAGENFTCGLRADGTAVCWGAITDGIDIQPPEKLAP